MLKGYRYCQAPEIVAGLAARPVQRCAVAVTVPDRDVKFEPTGPALGPKSCPAGLLRGMNAMLPGSCRAQNEQSNAKRIDHRA